MKPILMIKLDPTRPFYRRDTLQAFADILQRVFGSKYDIVATPMNTKVFPENSMSVTLNIDGNSDIKRIADDLLSFAEEAYIPGINEKEYPREFTSAEVREMLIFLAENGYRVGDLQYDFDMSPFGRESLPTTNDDTGGAHQYNPVQREKEGV